MDISVTHELIYRYSKPVYLEPQIIYLTPRWSFHQEIKDFQLEIFPEPVLISSHLDVEGNPRHIAHFKELTDSFTVKSSFRLVMKQWNPFEFIIYPYESQSLPLRYPQELLPSLSPYLTLSGDIDVVKAFTSKLFDYRKMPLPDFIIALAQAISVEFAYEYREEGVALAPEELLTMKAGACRDFSNLYMQACRQLGIASRFVSGYFYGDSSVAKHLHGWVEVFIPGGGWRGVDPTQGVMVDRNYIALASSPSPHNIAPVNGNFRGDATSHMQTELVMKEI